MIGLLGLLILYGAAYALSENRKAVSWGLIAWGIGLQIIFAFIILRTSWGQDAFRGIGDAVQQLLAYADRGSTFVFGQAADPGGNLGYVFAFRVLPIVIFISSFFSVLYYMGVMQRLVLLMAKGMHRLMGVSGSESLAAAANVFMGQTEAPIIVAPYIAAMTKSELMALMTSGMATVSGAVLASYVALGVRAEYLLTASVMAAPASLVMAKLLVPETEESKTAGDVTIDVEAEDVNIIDAAARGAGKGITLALNIGAMLIAFIALIYLIDGILGYIGGAFASLQELLVLLAIVAAIVAAFVFGWSPSERGRRAALAGGAAGILVAVAVFLLHGPGAISLGLRPILATVFAPLAYVMGVRGKTPAWSASSSASSSCSTSSSPTPSSPASWRTRLSTRNRSSSSPTLCAASPTFRPSASRSAASAPSPRVGAAIWRASACAPCWAACLRRSRWQRSPAC